MNLRVATSRKRTEIVLPMIFRTLKLKVFFLFDIDCEDSVNDEVINICCGEVD